MAGEKTSDEFKNALENKKLPILVLDNKWHHLFPNKYKAETLKSLEKELNDLMKRQGKLNSELKELKKLKSGLMQEIVEYMEQEKEKLEQNQKLILEINETIEQYEDELKDLPRSIKETNEKLMIESMEACYKELHENEEIIEKIGNWIKQVRIELKKNIIRKQTKEIKNQEIYSYMHDILGPEIIEVFDLKHKDNEE